MKRHLYIKYFVCVRPESIAQSIGILAPAHTNKLEHKWNILNTQFYGKVPVEIKQYRLWC